MKRDGHDGRMHVLLVLFFFLLPSGIFADSLSPGERAWTLLVQGQHEQVAAVAEEILVDEPRDARAAVCWIEALQALGREQEARGYFREVSNSDPASGIGPLGLGSIEFHQRRFAVAESLLNQALNLVRAREDPRGELVARERLGTVQLSVGRIDEAAVSFDRALALANSLREPLAVIFATYSLGYTRVSAGDNEEGEKLVRRALEDARKRGLHGWVGDAEVVLFILSSWGIDIDEARRHLDAALQAYESTGNLVRQAACLRHMASTNIRRGSYAEAILNLRRGHDLAMKGGDQSESSRCLGDLGFVNEALGDTERATRQWQEAVQTAGDSWPKEWRGVYHANIGAALVELERYEDAFVHLDNALLALGESSHGEAVTGVLKTLGRCLLETGRTEEAIQRLQEAVAVARDWNIQRGEVRALNQLGWCHLARGDLDAAEALFEEAGRLARGSGYIGAETEFLSGRARVARRRGDSGQALGYLEDALEIAEGVRRRSRSATAVQQAVFGTSRSLYEESVDLLYELHVQDPQSNMDRRAFDLAQRAKARTFLDLLAEGELDLRFRADPDYQRREQEILETIADLSFGETDEEPRSNRDDESEIIRLEDELSLLENKIRLSDPRYAEVKYPRPSTVEELQKEILEGGELVLEYFLGDSASYVWAVSTDSFRFIRLPGRKVIEGAVLALMPLLHDYNLLGADPTYFVSPANLLSAMLLGQLVEELPRANRVIIAPDDILHYLPFEGLLTEDVRDDAMSGGFESLPYLVFEHDVSYVPSISALSRLRRYGEERASSQYSAELLLVGNPRVQEGSEQSVFVRAATGRALPPLLYAEGEIKDLERLVPEGRSVVLEGEKATPGAVAEASSQGPYRLVHFAAHGVFNERRPQFSGLALSSDIATTDDGFLNIGEIFALDLPCSQVVLSACSSALGQRITGEGLVGLTRAFMYAGAQSVVATLWEVSGMATSGFMTSFYERMFRGGPKPRVSVLAEVKREMIRSGGTVPGPEGVAFAHPYFWSAVVMIGDGS